MKIKLRLRDLNNISREKVDYSIIMRELFNFKSRGIFRSIRFGKMFRSAVHLVREGRSVNPTECVINPDSKIKVPSNIDKISFKAMMELQAVMNNSNSEDIVEVVAEMITIVTYSESTGELYKEKELSHKAFRETVLDSPFEDMMGIYNWIVEADAESKAVWEKRFLSVQVIDKDYENAGGSAMAQFNVLNTIKTICRDFNCREEEAWQKSYGLTQTNSYEAAYSKFIQDNMRKAKEIKFERSRRKRS